MNKANLYKLRYYLVFLGLVTVLLVTAGLTGFTFFSARSEQWSPDGRTTYHK